MNSTLRTLILVTLVGLGVAAGSTVAASDASLTASPETAGETATHTAMVTVGTDVSGPFNGFSLNYSEAGVNVSNISVENITIGIDRGGTNSEDAVDENITGDIESVNGSDNGTLMLMLGGSYELSEGDEVVVSIENVQNPEAGEYSVELDINPESSGGSADAMLSISAAADGTGTSTGTGTETDVGTGTETDMGTDDETETGTGTEIGATETATEMGDGTATEIGTDAEGTENETVGVGADGTMTEGPGFGVVVAVLALLGAAFVVARKQQ